MSARRVFVVGAGKRVLATALPALSSLPDAFEVAGVFARSAREIEAGERRLRVRPLGELSAGELAPGDLVYVAVGKDAVPEVLASLARFDRSRLDLLVDTPVLRFKHLRHLRHLDGWARAGVAEDVVHLPWIETVRAAAGEIDHVLFDRSAYAYHAVAEAKALCREKIVRARHVRLPDGSSRRELELESASVVVLEPRDYSQGMIGLYGARAIADRYDGAGKGLLLAPIVEGERCVGFRAGDVVTHLAPEEIELARGDPPGASVTARMESMKRVGFRRLLESIAAGKGAYPIEQGLEDMAVDWFLERFGRWRAGAPFDLRSGLARALWGAVGRLR